jgi:hypothetical protein
MKLPLPPLRAVALATAVLAAAGGIAVASPVPAGEEIAVTISRAAPPSAALGWRETAPVRRTPGALARSQGVVRKRHHPARRRAQLSPTPTLVAEPRSPSLPEAQAVAPPAQAPASPPAVAPVPVPLPEPEPAPAPAPAPKTPASVEPGVPVEPVPASPGSLVVGIDGGYAGWSSTEVAYRAQLGAAVTRHEWDPRQPVDEQDEEVQIAAEQIHTRIHALLGANELGDPSHYRDWVVAFVRRYGAGGSFWAERPHLDASRYAIDTVELGNEPYFGTMSPVLYADTVRPTLEAIDDLGLPVKVVLPAYLHGANTSWIDLLYERIPDLNSLFHAFAFHPYWYGHHPATPGDSGAFERLDTLRRRMDELGAGAKPIHLTEYGESTASCGSECVSETDQAAHLAAMLAAVVARPDWKVEMLSVFQLLDRGTASADRELQFGLLREDGTPKPSYAPVRAAMQVYR